MKKIVSCQIPKAKIVRPLLAGSMLLVLAVGGAEAQGCVIGAQKAAQPPPPQTQQPPLTTSPLQTGISGSQGCVTGAQQQQQQQKK